ncbi:ComEA family DNA-binding protein [Maribacter aestuarii]|uniref:ComEA family DNA-binding protein n=1 Tax=Maribacter aestuarii TaxID=1130723 RepID=UPI00248B570D|nr:helix-hairpin-helix domain-containing protein [Maribacter aestuarii]
MKNFKSHFTFSKQERSGIFFLLLLLVSVQVGYFLYQKFKVDTTASLVVNDAMQQRIDSLKAATTKTEIKQAFPFNPNFITDYKGYTLGMSVEEIDRLHKYRAQNKFVNSAEEFQTVTQVSDSLLASISTNFKFPEWTKGNSKPKVESENQNGKSSLNKKASNEARPEQADLNLATAQDLKRIYGIGDKLSARIIKFRDRLRGFLVDEQLYDVYGLEPDVVERTLSRFKVLNPPKIEKIKINEASVQEIAELVYLQKNVAQGIVDYRNLNGSINSFDELSKVENFPMEKIDRIALYLSLKK